MIHVASALTALVTNEDGATMVEYAIMLACIAILCIGTVRLIGEKAFNLFGEADTGW